MVAVVQVVEVVDVMEVIEMVEIEESDAVFVLDTDRTRLGNATI